MLEANLFFLVNIGILTSLNISSVVIAPQYGEYYIIADGDTLESLDNHGVLQVTVSEQKLVLKTFSSDLGKFSSLSLAAKGKDNKFRIKPVLPEDAMILYDDDLAVSVQNGKMKLINIVDLDKYIAGVVKAEVGIKRTLEYYKVQAIICRTYLLSNSRRHEYDGYQLCDKVHCQVYHGSCSDHYEIISSVFSTAGMVIVDSALELATAPFHSNCGGQTANSEEVWSLPKSYLVGIKDTFCLNQKNADWEVKIPEKEWLGYLNDKFNYPLHDSSCYGSAFDPESGKRKPLFSHAPYIPFTQLRSDWKLRSSYFSMEEQNGWVIFKGKGYGHGVGLCQEGAIRMAELGFLYDEILSFYYTNVKVISINNFKNLLK